MANKKSRIKCPICGNYKIPSRDHVPPKSCGNSGKRIIHYFYSSKKGEPNKQEVQNGVHYDYICSECNNNLLGANLDIKFKQFYDYVKLSCDLNIVWTGDVVSIAKCVLAHSLATNKYSSSHWDRKIRKYIKFDILPNDMGLYLFYYPHNCIFTCKNAVPILFFDKEKRCNYMFSNNAMVDCLYFHPFAFIVSDRGLFKQGIDLFEIIRKNENTIILNKYSWFDLMHGIVLPPCWPCMISNTKEINTIDAIIGGMDLKSFNINIPKD